VSHLKERKEKICLNCGAALHGRFCHVCGQQNLEPKETVWHLVQHFFNDITHFDGSFFSTVKYLLRKPGFLSSEYMIGRRASYLNPIRMYVFTSAIFFIILFSLKTPDKIVNVKDTAEVGKGLVALAKDSARLEKNLAKEKDADDRQDIQETLGKLKIEMHVIRKMYGDTTTRLFTSTDRNLLYAQELNDSLKLVDLPVNVQNRISDAITRDRDDSETGFDVFGMHLGRYKSVAQYDSSERALPDSLRDGWFTRIIARRLIETQVEYHTDRKSWKEHFTENFLHSFPKILFFSLPFFALILNILYFRHKQYYYVDHGIFTIHLYCANFILILLMVLLSKLGEMIDVGWVHTIIDILIFVTWLYMLIYLYKAMRGFYKQGRVKTLVKYFISCFLAFIMTLILLLIFLVVSAITIH
jgi:hypothetical protein